LTFNFDAILDRRRSNSIKWKLYPEDVLPLWVADMDFSAPEPILAVLRRRLEHGILGYEMPSKELYETVAERMGRLYGWNVDPEMVLATPGVVAGFTAAAHALCPAGQGVLIQPPVYAPFIHLSESAGVTRQEAPLKRSEAGSAIGYSIDLDGFARAFDSGGAKTAMFLLCNPHNPTGQVYTRAELARMAEMCLEHQTVICSDEIHSELLLGAAEHVPVAAIDPRIAENSITLIAPSKTFNIPGLFCGFAIIPNKDLFGRYKKTVESLAMHVSNLGLSAAQVAFSGECDEWLAALRAYLTTNRDTLVTFVEQELPGVKVTRPDATYLAWLDCNALIDAGVIQGSPAEFFLKQARVGLNNGADFGEGGQGFVRLNFGCPRATLLEALSKIKAALHI
jgi:cysteine-S-conjugate beta-lyase